VTADELDQIENQGNQIGEDFSFGSVCLAVGVSFFISLCTTNIPSPKTFASFVAVVIVAFVLASYFGIRWLRQRSAAGSIVDKIRERGLAPLGEEGKEIKATELAQLPAQEAGGPEPGK